MISISVIVWYNNQFLRYSFRNHETASLFPKFFQLEVLQTDPFQEKLTGRFFFIPDHPIYTHILAPPRVPEPQRERLKIRIETNAMYRRGNMPNVEQPCKRFELLFLFLSQLAPCLFPPNHQQRCERHLVRRNLN